MAKKKGTAEKKELRIYKGGYFVAAKNREKAEKIVDKTSDGEPQIIILNPKKEVRSATVSRSVLRDRKPLRITSKRPKISR